MVEDVGDDEEQEEEQLEEEETQKIILDNFHWRHMNWDDESKKFVYDENSSGDAQ